jgi:hypothetical protein
MAYAGPKSGAAANARRAAASASAERPEASAISASCQPAAASPRPATGAAFDAVAGSSNAARCSSTSSPRQSGGHPGGASSYQFADDLSSASTDSGSAFVRSQFAFDHSRNRRASVSAIVRCTKRESSFPSMRRDTPSRADRPATATKPLFHGVTLNDCALGERCQSFAYCTSIVALDGESE